MPLDYTILAPSVVTKVISRIITPGETLQRFWGFQPGGGNVAQDAPDGARTYNYDVFDSVRTIAKGRAPGTGPATIARNPVGTNTVHIARAYEKVPDLSFEHLDNIRAIGQNAGERDARGMRYLEMQGRMVAQRHKNFREFLTWGMMRGSCGFVFDGDDWVPVLSSPDLTIDFQIPAGNKTQLNMLGAGSILDTTWSNAAAGIPADLDAINIAFQNLVGAPLAWIVTDSVVWNHVMNNTDVKNQSGTANTVFDEFEETSETGPDGYKIGNRYAILKCRPMIRWYITDAVLSVNGTVTKYFDGGEASFGIDQMIGYAKMQEGSERVKETPWADGSYRRGFTAWLKEWDEPARVELHGLSNLVPELTIPKAIAFGDVLF